MPESYDKYTVLQLIIAKLKIDLDVLQRAAQTAYETATHEENIAENKYDTLGLEASYLATGQARRVEEIRHSLGALQNLKLRPFDRLRGIQIGDLVNLEANRGGQQQLFIGPGAAGLKIQQGNKSITVITPHAPLGKNLIGRAQGDIVEIVINHERQSFEVKEVQ
ncbi:transcription elongation factor GreAB [Pseudomonas sp. CCC3.2]|uniref:GreA/GreB family elongation factor n=1 Tax=unclassified Pseudomonas TaxID=196821 RepID=UPI002AB5D4DD|nr:MULTISPECIES: transcription elongation factor GreAB [unclassified Pseudomonas]MDY7561357.1 transcription elongation factor GreAB [Pseudomonas sp. AB6]MEA9978501.1 transcription elongation factor GreAB [Pseudomonas sp. RTS4]MEB0181945.1 transcription elongation factor GreAB [Pseudomonas sp. CCC3.2]MEB0199045.1 transcription elongation factor GreAB [Pseudomonas sp. 5S4]MEB0212899.1 transcription elongation factor GreAB [Pseudomonas sp. AB6]